MKLCLNGLHRLRLVWTRENQLWKTGLTGTYGGITWDRDKDKTIKSHSWLARDTLVGRNCFKRKAAPYCIVRGRSTVISQERKSKIVQINGKKEERLPNCEPSSKNKPHKKVFQNDKPTVHLPKISFLVYFIIVLQTQSARELFFMVLCSN